MLVIAVSIDVLGDAIWTKVNRVVYSAFIALDAVEPSFLNCLTASTTSVTTKVVSPHNV